MYKKLDEKTLDLILETGIDQFAQCGLDRANINTIAKTAGVSVGVLYKYFGDKDSFFLACVRHSLSLLDQVLQEAVAHETDIESGIRSIVKSLGKDEAESIIKERGTIEVTCSFCGAKYVMDAIDVEALFHPQTVTPPTTSQPQ